MPPLSLPGSSRRRPRRLFPERPLDPGAALRRWPGPFFSAFLGTLLLLAACTPAVREIEPPLALPGQFSAAGTGPAPGRWWQTLDDPALDQLIERALAGNFTLLAAWDRLRQAEALARLAGAPLRPSLDLEAGAALTHTDGDNGTIRSESYALGPAAAYEVDLWGRLRSRQQAAALSAAASREDLQAAALSLSAQVASLWYQLAEQERQLDLLAGQLAINTQVLDLVTFRFRRGQVGAADVLQQRQLVQATRGRQAEAASQLAVTTHRLAILLGMPPGQADLPQAAGLIGLPPLPRTGLPAALLLQRPDLRRARFQVQAADQTLAAALADRFPRLSLSARAETGGDRVRDLFSNWLANLAANLTGPLTDGGRRRAEIDRSRAAAAEELHAFGQAILQALGEVEDALAREARQREFIASLDQQLALAGQVTDRVRDRYLRGQENYLRVLDALLSEQDLERNRLTAQRQLIQDRIDLYLALGGGFALELRSRMAELEKEREE